MKKNEMILSKENLKQWQKSMISVKQQQNEGFKSRQVALLNNYPDPIDLMVKYNPDLQAKLIRSGKSMGEIAQNANIPSLGLLNSTYGDITPIEWLKTQIGSLNDYAENGKGITSEQLTELANLILAEYYYLNMAEICLFVARFKLGYYGEFYGAIGPMKIAKSLRQFLNDRRIDCERWERERDIAEKEAQHKKWAEEAITREEYLKLKQHNLL